MTVSVRELEELEIIERGLAADSAKSAEGGSEKLLREQYELVRVLRVKQEELRTAATAADKETNAAKLKALSEPQQKLISQTKDVLQGLTAAAAALPKNVAKDSADGIRLAAVQRALQQAALDGAQRAG